MKFLIWFLLLALSNFVLGGKWKNETLKTGMSKRGNYCPVNPRGKLYLLSNTEETALGRPTLMCNCYPQHLSPRVFGGLVAMVDRESGIHLYNEILTASAKFNSGKSPNMPGAYIDYQAFDKWKPTFAQGGKVRFVFWKKIGSSYKAVVDIIFNGKGSDSVNWFARNRVLEIVAGPDVAYSRPRFFNFWSMRGFIGRDFQRNFLVNHWSANCDTTNGMIFTLELPDPCGNWLGHTARQAGRGYPRFGYSTTGFICVWGHKDCWDEADKLAIYTMMS